ncbi:Trs120-domain-containing protein [Saitoella complicata NRRL Y-17804]|uniref:Trs120-domain-containing protein n=1 Tax=Saitoella complicata (strain BCRC 22490 / CBS 7301 / JCM 7358 / NBRC 10748 / NRRL Y-17804) TaxID=698492 RepID=UPI0008679AB3|nr:Trs120-domain-containing protein [Saitoella complicata NRRL Y-17804]ODQ51891.1 Trs120-domain-containing protein [Saitoella complicata NRRL Y-17804]
MSSPCLPLDSLSYVAPSRIRVLCVPIGRIKRSTFDNCVTRLQACRMVRLGDVSADTRKERATCSPQGFPDGRVVYDVGTSFDQDHEYLEEFQMWRRTMGIIAIADGAEENDLEALNEGMGMLKMRYPRALVQQCFVFHCEVAAEGKYPEHSAFIYSKRASKASSFNQLRTVMCDFTATMLSEFAPLAQRLQSLTTLDSPHTATRLSYPSSENLVTNSPRYSLPPAAPNGELKRSSSMSSKDMKRYTMSGLGSSAGSMTERAKSKGKGRVSKTLGDLYLLAGRLPDAMREYAEAVAIAKANSDHLWHAAALDGIGIALVLMAYLHLDYQIPAVALVAAAPVPDKASLKAASSTLKLKSSAKTSSSRASSPARSSTLTEYEAAAAYYNPHLMDFIPDLQNAIAALHQRSTNFREDSVPPLIYSETILRCCKFLCAVHVAGGWNDAALDNIVTDAAIPPSTKSGYPPRAEIAARAIGARGIHLDDMFVMDRIHVLGGLASVLGAIGLERKRALFLREIVQTIVPELIQARVVGAAEQGMHPAARMLNNNATAAPALGPMDLERGVLGMLEDMCAAYGIAVSAGDDDAFEKEVVAGQFGWSQLKLSVLRDCISLCEALPDFPGVLRFTTKLLAIAVPYLTKEEQGRLATNLARTVGAAKRIGMKDVEAVYWDPFVVRDVQVVKSQVYQTPTALPMSTLLPPVEADGEGEKKADNPFLYNPFEKKVAVKAENLLVEGELAEFEVVLQNPFGIDLDVQSLALEVTGVDMETQPIAVVIPPNSVQPVVLKAKLLSTGTMIVTGCKIRILGCQEQSFPIREPPDAEELDKWVTLKDVGEKTKKMGLSARKNCATAQANGSGPLAPPRDVSITVVPPQPLATVSATTLTNGATMLLEGERRVVEVTLTNVSSTPIDLVLLSFSDSTTGPLEQALANKSIPPDEAYELEVYLYNRRAFSWDVATEGKVNIAPGAEETFKVDILGKRGLTDGRIQLTVPLLVTVNASIDMIGCDVFPFAGEVSQDSDLASRSTAAKAFAEAASGEGCLLLIDLRNVWPNSMHVELSISNGPGDESEQFTASDLIQPGRTSRLALPLRRIDLGYDDFTRGIPSLSPKQFVVSAGKYASPEQERQAREAFWYREELLKRIGGKWKDLESDREGAIEMRGLRLSARMVDLLRVPLVEVEIERIEGEGVTSIGKRRWRVEMDEFVQIRTVVRNRKPEATRFFLRLQPSMQHQPLPTALDLARRVAWNGCLQTSIGVIQPGGEVEHVIDMIFLAKGDYEFVGSVEELEEGGARGKIWTMREAGKVQVA